MEGTLTLDQLKIYKKYRGDPDSFQRSASSKEAGILSGDAWALISELTGAMFLVQSHRATDDFSQNVLVRIKRSCDSELTINELQSISNSDWFLKR